MATSKYINTKILYLLVFLQLLGIIGGQIIINPPDLDEQMEEFLKENSEYESVKSFEKGEDDPEDQDEEEEQGPGILTVGIHFIDTEYTMDYYKKTFKAFILAEASYDCEKCFEAEEMIDKVFKLFAMNELAYKKKELPIVRREVPSLTHPRISIYFKGTLYEYQKGCHLDLFISFLNRHLFPVVALETREDIEEFQDTSKEWVENTPLYNGKYRKLGRIFDEMEKVTRVIAFVSDKKEHQYELKQLKEAAKELGFRDDLRIAKIVNKDLVMEYKEEMGTKWFDEGSTNSMVVFSSSKASGSPLNYYDLSSETVHLSYWINSASIEHLEKMNVFSVQIMESMHMPMYVAFVDVKKKKYVERSNQLLQVIRKVAYDYPYFLFGYFDNNSYDAKKNLIGIEGEEMPQFALFNPPNNVTVVFPTDKEINQENIRLFLDNGLDAAMKGEPIFKDQPKKKSKSNKSKIKETNDDL
ncbi:unnamed protein product [Moneuplotes crassus]|uniref:Thioredoxin domain-containing protein n=1 Tax=Euplotes crassus TaxID=5936 RepID=A0AAD1UFA2_EUPCR|nr:unnamed protein product [Moneuplotes crassus]